VADVHRRHQIGDGLADAAETFQFALANNSGVADQAATTLLGQATRVATGASAGAWTTFRLSISPAQNRLLAQVNGVDVYNGAIPAGGPHSGAVQIGFRENHAGAPGTAEGTWIDDLQLTATFVPVTVSSVSVE
jgi:hypothetical protein